MPAQAPSPTTQVDYSLGGRQYGADGILSDRKVAIALSLAWPQTYTDMIGTFGYPMHRDQSADYYQIEGSDKWLKIYYTERSATGCEIISSQ